MVIVRYKCGLGNQLFQYAAGTALARRLGTAACCDLRWFDGANRKRQRRDRRDYLLPELGFTLPEAPRADVDAYYPKWWQRWLGRKVPGTLLTQDHRPLLAEFLAVTGDACLDGYWQGEPFFAAAKADVAAALLAQQPRRAETNEWIAALQEPGAIAVHVRRGDYAHSASPRELLGPLDDAYYRRAIAALGGTQAVVLTDDPAWCRAEFDPGVPFTCIEHPDTAAGTIDDLLTMGHARGVAIANSTFSWWGAWIATQRGARVVAPARWFNNRTYANWELHLHVPGWQWL
jgi:hypothetical protein